MLTLISRNVHFHQINLWSLSLLFLLSFQILAQEIEDGSSSEHSSKDKDVVQFAQSSDCGVVEVQVDEAGVEDPRSRAPWTAAIFKIPLLGHDESQEKSPAFHVSGVIINPTTILTVAGGPFGAFPRGIKSQYLISPPENFIVGTGLKTTDFMDQDEFSQISKVSLILPFMDHPVVNLDFHYLLYRLQTPLNLSKSPFVRSLCLPFLLRTINIQPFRWHLFQTGFSAPVTPSGHLVLRGINVVAGTMEKCHSDFRYYYGGRDGPHTFCGQSRGHRNSNKGHQGSSLEKRTCFTHGGVGTFQAAKKWFLAGMISLVPRRMKGQCPDDPLYIFSRELLPRPPTPAPEDEATEIPLDWIQRSTFCKEDEFPCKTIGACIPMTLACDLKPDCPPGDESDEDQAFCGAQTNCSSWTESSSTTGGVMYPCGLGHPNSCVKASQICDGVQDCPGVIDESGFACEYNEIRRGIREGRVIDSLEESKKCPPLETSPGVQVRCLSTLKKAQITECDPSGEVDPGTIAILSCDNYTVPKFSLPVQRLICGTNGRWSNSDGTKVPFLCDTECGQVIMGDPEAETGNGSIGSKSYPWHVGIFKNHEKDPEKNATSEWICTGTLIEPSFVISSANCLVDLQRSSNLTNYKVVVAPLSDYRFELPRRNANNLTFGVKQVWIPPSYDPETNSLEIGLLKLDGKVKGGTYSRPICYLSPQKTEEEEEPTGGIIGLLNRSSSSVTPQPMTLTFTKVSIVPSKKCGSINKNSRLLFTFCVGNEKDDSCLVDSGSGIYFLETHGNKSRYVLGGIVTKDRKIKGCEEGSNRGKFTSFTRISAYENWLRKTMEENS